MSQYCVRHHASRLHLSVDSCTTITASDGNDCLPLASQHNVSNSLASSSLGSTSKPSATIPAAKQLAKLGGKTNTFKILSQKKPTSGLLTKGREIGRTTNKTACPYHAHCTAQLSWVLEGVNTLAC
jgi:hypothetical protein